MALILADNFSYQARKPLDARLVVSSLNDLTSMVEATIYDGIIVYVLTEKRFYVYNSANALEPTLGKWRELNDNSSANNGLIVSEYQPDTAYDVNTLLYCDTNLGRVTTTYTSSNIDPTNAKKCWEEDIKNGNIYVFNDHPEIVSQYY